MQRNAKQRCQEGGVERDELVVGDNPATIQAGCFTRVFEGCETMSRTESEKRVTDIGEEMFPTNAGLYVCNRNDGLFNWSWVVWHDMLQLDGVCWLIFATGRRRCIRSDSVGLANVIEHHIEIGLESTHTPGRFSIVEDIWSVTSITIENYFAQEKTMTLATFSGC